jgi:hypothetical protein
MDSSSILLQEEMHAEMPSPLKYFEKGKIMMVVCVGEFLVTFRSIPCRPTNVKGLM